MNRMNRMGLLAGMTALSSVPYDISSSWGLGDIFPETLPHWTPSRPNKHTAKVKRKRRIRNKIARESRRRNREK